METTAKIKRVVNVKEYTNSHGTTHYHNLEMDNGDKINIGKKKVQEVGNELTYEIVGDKKQDGTYQQEFPKAKSVQKQQGKNEDYVKGIEAGHAVNNAVNLICAGADLDLLDGKEPRNMEHRIYLVAHKIHQVAQTLKAKI